jgi:hypothetical protein
MHRPGFTISIRFCSCAESKHSPLIYDNR